MNGSLSAVLWLYRIGSCLVNYTSLLVKPLFIFAGALISLNKDFFMRRCFYVLLYCCCISGVFAQVSGKIVGSKGQPLARINVEIVRITDSSSVKASFSNDSGWFSLQGITAGAYILRLTGLGYRSLISPLFKLPNSQPATMLGTLVMQEDVKEITGVLVQAAKPLFRQDMFGTIVNAESSMLTRGSSVLELLQRSPGIAVDYRLNSFSLNGKTGVLVMLNGRPLRMPADQVFSLLSGLRADEVERIALLTSPPAGYDAEGAGGIINIVLKKNRKTGNNASFTLTQGYGKGAKLGAGFDASSNRAHTNIYGSYNFSYDRSYNDLSGSSYQDFPVLGGPMTIEFSNVNKPVQYSHTARMGIDARLNTRTTAGISIDAGSLVVNAAGYNQRIFRILPDSLLYFDGNIRSVNRWTNLNSAAYLERRWNAGEKLEGALDYLYYQNSHPVEAQNVFLNKDGDPAVSGNDTIFAPRQRGQAHTQIMVIAGKTDYHKQLNKQLQLETGAKITYTRTKSRSFIESLIASDWIGRPETSNDGLMKELITAVYFSSTIQFNEATSLVAGLRYEYSYIRMQDATGSNTIGNSNGRFFPALFFSRKNSDHAGWQLSYTSRISRPSYADLASFVTYNDPVTVFTGNQLLKSTISHTLKLGYHYKSYSFTVLFGQDNNPIARYQETAASANNLVYLSPQNLNWQHSIDVQAVLPLKLNRWWNAQYSITAGWRQFKETYTPLPVKKAYCNGSIRAVENFTLPGNLALEVSGGYQSYSYEGTIKTDGYGSADLGIRKVFKNNKGVLQLSITDLFKSVRYRNAYGVLTPEVFDGRSRLSYHPESWNARILRLSYTRALGAGTMHRQRNAGMQDEQERLKQ